MAFPRVAASLIGITLIGMPLIAMAAATGASAQTPSAIVEDVTGHPPGVEFMDYVQPGRIIALGPADAIVLSYLNSCAREVIRGGSVKVGVDESEALTARIERTRVDCEAGKMMRAAGQTNDSASLIIRGGERPAAIRPAPDPEFTLYGLNPLIELRGVGKLVIARLDAYGEYYALTIDPERLLRGTFLDLAAEGKSLTAGGVYGARWNRRLIVFKVDPGARPGRGPVAGRLLRLDPPS